MGYNGEEKADVQDRVPDFERQLIKINSQCTTILSLSLQIEDRLRKIKPFDDQGAKSKPEDNKISSGPTVLDALADISDMLAVIESNLLSNRNILIELV